LKTAADAQFLATFNNVVVNVAGVVNVVDVDRPGTVRNADFEVMLLLLLLRWRCRLRGKVNLDLDFRP
jgi:hypothetical protein